MPNHTSNVLTISGDPARLKELISKVGVVNKDGTKQDISLEKIIPIPEDLRIDKSTSVITGISIINWQTTGDDSELKPMLENKYYIEKNITNVKELVDFLIKEERVNIEMSKKAIENLDKYGHMDWYDWSIENWGTKWDIYDCGDWYFEDDNVVMINFYTAWSPPISGIGKLSEQYRDLKFRIEYADEGGDYVGYTSFENGVETEQEEYDWDSEEGIEIRDRVGYYIEEDSTEDTQEDTEKE